MKKLFLIFALLLGGVVAFAQVTDTIDPPADTVIVNGQIYTLEDADEVSVELSREYNGPWDAPTLALVYIIDSASGVQVSCGRAITANTYAWPESTTPIPITFTRGKATIRLKGTAGDDIVIVY